MGHVCREIIIIIIIIIIIVIIIVVTYMGGIRRIKLVFEF